MKEFLSQNNIEFTERNVAADETALAELEKLGYLTTPVTLVGEDVVVCLGEGARSTLGSVDLPIEAAVLGIVDRVDLAEELGRRPLTLVDGVALPSSWRRTAQEEIGR